MTGRYPTELGKSKHEKERARRERRAAKAVRKAERQAAKVPGQGAPVDWTNGQFPSAFPNAPESAAGIGRTLSRGL